MRLPHGAQGSLSYHIILAEQLHSRQGSLPSKFLHQFCIDNSIPDVTYNTSFFIIIMKLRTVLAVFLIGAIMRVNGQSYENATFVAGEIAQISPCGVSQPAIFDCKERC